MFCNRLGIFGKKEKHKCFQCECYFSPGNAKTCEKCNWKLCNYGHCGCTISGETKLVLEGFYELFCAKEYSKQTKKALLIMLETFYKYCRGCLK